LKRLVDAIVLVALVRAGLFAKLAFDP